MNLHFSLIHRWTIYLLRLFVLFVSQIEISETMVPPTTHFVSWKALDEWRVQGDGFIMLRLVFFCVEILSLIWPKKRGTTFAKIFLGKTLPNLPYLNEKKVGELRVLKWKVVMWLLWVGSVLPWLLWRHILKWSPKLWSPLQVL